MPRHNPASDASQVEGSPYFPETDIDQVNEPADRGAADSGNAVSGANSDAVTEAVSDGNGVTAVADVVDKTMEAVGFNMADPSATDQAVAAGPGNNEELDIKDGAARFADQFNSESDLGKRIDQLDNHMAEIGSQMNTIAQRAVEASGENDMAQAEGQNRDDAAQEGTATLAGHAFHQIGHMTDLHDDIAKYLTQGSTTAAEYALSIR